MKKSIIIYADCIAILEELTNEQAGRLFKAILSYVNEEPATEIVGDPAVRMAFTVLKNQIDRDSERYAERCEKNRQIAIERERRRKELRAQTNTNVHERAQTNTNVTYNDNDSDNDNESTKVDNIKKTPTNVGGKEIAAAVAATHSKSVSDRQKAFYNTLIPFVGKYPNEMLRTFYDYWSEPNRSNTKMRMELERTWDLSRRLATWHKKDEERKFNNKNNGNNNQRNNGAEQRAGEVASIIARLAAEDDSRK